MKKIITLFFLTATLLFCFRTTCTAGSWTKITSSITNDIYCVAYGNNCFIAIDCDYSSTPTISKIYKSTDYGQTWTQKTTMSGTTIYTVAYVNGKFIATDGSSGNGYYSTDDGNTWTQCQIADGFAIYGITYGSSGYAAVRTEGNGYSDIYKSSDGISWTRTLNVATGNLAAIGYGNNTYVAVGSIGNQLYTSSDANNWTTRTNPSSQYFQGIAYGNGTFVAVAGSGTIIRSTDNGVSWASVTYGTADINAVAYGNGYFYAVGGNGVIIKSTDGSSWSTDASPVTGTDLWGIAYGNGYFVATGVSGAITVINIPSKPTVTTTAPSTVTSTSATLGGNVTEDGSLTIGERGIVYSSTNTNPQIGGAGVTKVPYATGGKGSYSQIINPLSQGIAYSYNAYATNTKGTSYGDAQTFSINTISSITRSNPATTNASSVSWTVTLAGPVTGLTASNFSLISTGLTSHSITGVTGSGTTWTVTANTGTGDGSLGLNLTNSTETSAVFTNTLPFAGDVYTIDKTPPTTVLSSTASEPTNVSPIPVAITFSESVADFEASDIAVTNGTKGALSGSGASYSINITPSGQGAVTVNIAAGVAADAAGNSNTAATQFSRTYDNVSPTVTLSSTASEPTNASPIPVTIIFSETVTGFDASDITVANGTKGTLSGSGASYSIDVTPSAAGTVTIDVAAGVVADAAGNSNTAASSLTRNYITVPDAPTIGTATAGDGQAFVTFTAPASNGGSPITGYTVTSNPDGKTGTRTSSPITIKLLTNGTPYTFTVTAINGAGPSAASAPSNPVTPSTATGIDDAKLEGVTIYPNPVDDRLYIKGVDEGEIAVYDMGGCKVISTKLESNKTVDVSGLTKGVYTVRITTPNGIAEKKLVKK